MPAEWVEQSGIFQLGAPLRVIDLQSRFQALVEGRRHEVPSRGVLDVLEGHAEEILRSYLIEHGIALSVPAGGWRVQLRRSRVHSDQVVLIVKDPRGKIRGLRALEEQIARWCCERAASG